MEPASAERELSHGEREPSHADSTEECAICFDVIRAEDRLPLPCNCNVPYCPQCWDRALAQAFNDAGCARCPSCRSAVCVNFDPEAAGGRGRLVFSAEEVGGDGDGASSSSRADVVNRLAGQAAPLMTRLLRRYGEQHPTLRSIAREPSAALSSRRVRELKELLSALGGEPATCVEKADLVERLLEAAGSAGRLAAHCVACDDDGQAEGEADPAASGARCVCVCGGQLQRLGGRARLAQLISAHYPQLEEAQLARLVELQVAAGSSCVVCDLCDQTVPPTVPVYTCGNGDKTILHPTTYDVCEACFVRYAVEGVGDEALPTERVVQ